MERLNVCAVIAALLLLAPARGSGQIPEDKWLHFGAGVLAGGAGAYAGYKISGGDPWWTFGSAVGASLLAGLAKEALDERNYGGWDNADLAATVAGGIVAGVTVELVFTPGRRRGRRYTFRLKSAAPQFTFSDTGTGIPPEGFRRP